MIIRNQIYKRYLYICKSFSAGAIVGTIKLILHSLNICKMFNLNYDNNINTLENNWMIKSQGKAKKDLYNLQ